MKKKVGELYDKPIVIGNPNEFTKNEIALSDLGGDSFDDGMEYYLIVDEEIKYYAFQGFNIVNSAIGYDINNNIVCVIDPGQLPSGYIKIAVSLSTLIISDPRETNTVKDAFEQFCAQQNWSLSNPNHFKRITAKEYYSLLG